MIKVMYSTLKGRDEKIIVDVEQIVMTGIYVDRLPKEMTIASIKEQLKMMIDMDEIEFQLDPFVKHLEEHGHHIDPKTGKAYLEEESEATDEH